MARVRSTVDQTSIAWQPRYNLFRRRRQPDLYCAVPEDRPVPSFVTSEHWAFAGSRTGTAPPPGFDRVAAELGIRLNGFHLFEIVRPMPRLRAARQFGPKGPKSLVDVTMKREMKRRVAQQSRCMAAMMVHLNVDAMTASREACGVEFAAATFRCLMCDHSRECGEWCADPNRGSGAPVFCPDADFFMRHRVGRAVA